MGAILSGATAIQLHALLRFSELIGNVFQMRDDMLDVKEDAFLPSGGARSSTVAAKLGDKRVRERMQSLVAEAKDVLLSQFGDIAPVVLLCQIADYVAERKI
jgi:hypothetical protein